MSEAPKTPSREASGELRTPPDDLFYAWLKVIPAHPQTHYGGMGALGKLVFSGDYSLYAIGKSVPSKEQLKEALFRAKNAHASRNIVPPAFANEETAFRSLSRVWGNFTFVMLTNAANYCSLATTGRGAPLFSEAFIQRDGLDTRVRVIQKAFAAHPELKRELATLFSLVQDALETPELKALEEERRSLLDYSVHGEPIQDYWALLTPAGWNRAAISRKEITYRKRAVEAIARYIADHAKEANLSVQSYKKLRGILSKHIL